MSGPYFPVFGLNTEKYGPEITPYLDTVQIKYYRYTFDVNEPMISVFTNVLMIGLLVLV